MKNGGFADSLRTGVPVLFVISASAVKFGHQSVPARYLNVGIIRVWRIRIIRIRWVGVIISRIGQAPQQPQPKAQPEAAETEAMAEPEAVSKAMPKTAAEPGTETVSKTAAEAVPKTAPAETVSETATAEAAPAETVWTPGVFRGLISHVSFLLSLYTISYVLHSLRATSAACPAKPPPEKSHN